MQETDTPSRSLRTGWLGAACPPPLATALLGLMLSLAGCSPWARGQDYTLVVLRSSATLLPCEGLWSIPQYPNTLMCYRPGQTTQVYPFIDRRDIERLIPMRANGTQANYE